MFGVHRNVKMTTNLATSVYAVKSEKLHKHSLIELTLSVQITAPKVMSGTYQSHVEALGFHGLVRNRNHRISGSSSCNSTCEQTMRS